MKEKRILDVLGKVDEQYIEEAAPTKCARKSRSWLKWGAMAACLCLLGVGILQSDLFGRPGQMGSLTMPLLRIPRAGGELPILEYSINLSSTNNIPATANVYKYVEELPDAEVEVEKLSRLLGVAEEVAELQDFEDFLILNDGEKMINYERFTGVWSFTDKTYDTQKKHNLPSDEKACEIASEFLKERGLYNERFSIETVVTQYSGSELDSSYSPYCKTVYFYPQIDGYQVLGTSRIVVDVGEDGKIVGVMKNYKDFDEVGVIEVADPQTFIKGIKANSYSSNINSNAVSASIDAVQLGYWEDPESFREQPYIQPVWIFSGESIQIDGTKETFVVIVQAAKNVEVSDS